MTERELLAAEYALRLLEGEEQMKARRLAASDPAFAAEVAFWEEGLAPFFDDIPEEAPSAGAWERILRRLDAAGDGAVLALRRRLARWRAGALAACAAAAPLLVLQLAPESRAPVAPPASSARPAPLFLASLVAEEAPDALTVAFKPDSSELVVTPVRIAPPPGRSRELWLIPAGAAPISLGLVRPDGVQRRTLPSYLARRFSHDATVALSDEPAGGSPTGQPTGAVLAAGTLAPV